MVFCTSMNRGYLTQLIIPLVTGALGYIATLASYLAVVVEMKQGLVAEALSASGA